MHTALTGAQGTDDTGHWLQRPKATGDTKLAMAGEVATSMSPVATSRTTSKATSKAPSKAPIRAHCRTTSKAISKVPNGAASKAPAGSSATSCVRKASTKAIANVDNKDAR